MKISKQALGKGLSALISTDDDDFQTAERLQPLEMPLNLLVAGKSQPRGYFEESSLQELAESIKKNGVIQPILVRKLNDISYEIIAGERRFRASKLAGLQTMPVIIKELDNRQALELALIENIQRENLTAIEEAEGYKRLQEEFNYTQEQLGNVLGKSRSHVANMLRLLTLPQSIKDMLNSGLISMGHARVLVGVEGPQALAERIVNEGLSVRDAEKFASGSMHSQVTAKERQPSQKRNNSTASSAQKDEDLLLIERSLSDLLGMKISIEEDRVVLYYNNLTELDKILQRIG